MIQKIDPQNLTLNPFDAIGRQWMLVTAGTPERCNTMTASWGGLGVFWNQPFATCYIRPQRYTREFLDASEYFTLSFLPEQYRPQLKLCGAKSGREIDKVKECGFTVAAGAGNAPYFEQAELVLVCRKALVMPMDPSAVPQEARERFYPDQDYHILYGGVIVEAYQNV